MISVIIPTYKEEDTIGATVRYLKGLQARDKQHFEIIVVDGQSPDLTVQEAELAGARTLISQKKGRASQMNAGAAVALGDVLYFLHADSIPPTTFFLDIASAVEVGFNAGCYRLSFDHPHWFLKLNAWFTQFNLNQIRFGDQSLFVTTSLFKQVGMFDESLIVMEDQEIIYRIRKFTKFKVMDKTIVTSARKYLDNGIYTMQGIFFIIYFMYKMNYSQQKIVNMYKRLIYQDKL